MLDRLKWILLAGVALLSGFWGFRYLRPEPGGDAVDRYFEPYPIPKSAPLSPDIQNWLFGVTHYGQGRFAEACTAFQAARSENRIPAFMVEFYLGQSFLAVDKADSAVACFQNVMQANSGISSLSRWYLALALLGNGDLEVAKMHLRILEEENGFRSRDAADLLESL